MNEDQNFQSTQVDNQTDSQVDNESTSTSIPGENTNTGPNFAHLGAPREYEDHEVVGNINGSSFSNDPLIKSIASIKSASHPSYSFKLVKTDTVGPVSPLRYAVWGALTVIVIISVMASLTQGILLVKDRLFSPNIIAQNSPNQNNQNYSSNNNQNQSNTANGQQEPLGSDDGKSTSEATLNFTPMYKVANADSIQNLGITAKGFYVADLKSGERIVAKNPNGVYSIASVSKLMTAVIAYEKMDLQKVVVVSRDSYATYGAQGELLPGEKIKLGDLMYPVLMESSNDGTEVIAESYGRADFLIEMNKKAALLGMHDTYYEDPSGLNPKNVSTSEDLFKLVKYIKEKAPVLLDMTRVREFAILKHKWLNKNRFLNTELFTGGKNGYIDESRWTTASTFEIVMAKGGKRQIAITLLKSENREGDAMKIINFLQKNAYYTETGNF